LRGTFVIDPDGNLKHATVNDTAVGRNVEETIRTLAAFPDRQADGLRLAPRDKRRSTKPGACFERGIPKGIPLFCCFRFDSSPCIFLPSFIICFQELFGGGLHEDAYEIA
jgi:hypothetical protein